LEAWRFTNINPILRTPLAPMTDPGDTLPEASDLASFLYGGDWTELVFVDGWYAPSLSRNAGPGTTVKVASLRESLAAGDDWMAEHLGRYLQQSDSIFSALNTALFRDGAVIQIPKAHRVEQPIHIVFVTSSAATGKSIQPRVLVVADAQSESTVIESHVNLAGAEATLSCPVTEIALAPQARMTAIKVLEEGPQGYHLSSTQVRQERDSRYEAYTFNVGGAIGRNELRISLNGEGAECSLRGLTLTDNARLLDNALSVEHQAAHCKSWIGYKSVLADKSHSVFCGRVYVAPGAQQTDSNQLNQNLLLSDRATANTKPQLEIYADDVKCTHGATVGQPPQEQIFYFQTRGMDEAMARGILTYGFADEVITELPVEPVRKRLDRLVFDKYSPK